MMEDETRQFFIGLFKELETKMNAGQEELKADISALETNLKGDISALKTNINDMKQELKKEIKVAFNAGREGLKSETSAVKNDIENSISDVKGDISAPETKINACHEGLGRGISVLQERIRNVEAGQAAFEERVTCTVDAQLRDMSSVVEQQTRNLREDLNSDIEATRQDVEATRRDLEAQQR
jgi:gas vesicle protein